MASCTMFFVRVILVGWQHPFYTAFIGIGLAISRLSRNTSIKIIAPIIGLGHRHIYPLRPQPDFDLISRFPEPGHSA